MREVLSVTDAGTDPVPVAAPVLEALDAGKGTDDERSLRLARVEVPGFEFD